MITRCSSSTHGWKIISTPYICRLHISCNQPLMEVKREVVDNWGNWGTGKSSLPKSIHGFIQSEDSASSSNSNSMLLTVPYQKPQLRESQAQGDKMPRCLIKLKGREKWGSGGMTFESDYASFQGWKSLWEVGQLLGLKKMCPLSDVADLQYK